MKVKIITKALIPGMLSYRYRGKTMKISKEPKDMTAGYKNNLLPIATALAVIRLARWLRTGTMFFVAVIVTVISAVICFSIKDHEVIRADKDSLTFTVNTPDGYINRTVALSRIASWRSNSFVTGQNSFTIRLTNGEQIEVETYNQGKAVSLFNTVLPGKKEKPDLFQGFSRTKH